MTSPTSPPNRYRNVLLVLGFVLVVGISSWLVWHNRTSPVPPTPDLTEVLVLNNRGIGLMEQFEYAAAAKAFRDVVARDPNWLPGRINLGIALLNQAEEPTLNEAAEIFESVLKQDSTNRHAHYCLGMIFLHRGNVAKAGPHFEEMTRLEPKDAHSWYHLGRTHPNGEDSPEAKACFELALKLNPYLNAARYALAMHPHEKDDARSQKLIAEQQALVAANWESEYRITYTEMGPFAEVLGRDPKSVERSTMGPLPMYADQPDFEAVLAPTSRWASQANLEAVPAGGKLLAAARKRFGGTMVVFDANGDQHLDVLMLSAAIERGQPRDVLLISNGKGKFYDRTLEFGLVNQASISACVASLDNDGLPDLIRSTPDGVTLHRLKRDGKSFRFEDQSAVLGDWAKGGVTLGLQVADLDQDGDLDLLAANYASSIEQAIRQFNGDYSKSDGGLRVLLNTSVPPAVPPGQPAPAMQLQFTPLAAPSELLVSGPVIGTILSDFDGDRDLDVLVMIDGKLPLMVLNDRLLRFRRNGLVSNDPQAWDGGLAVDPNLNGKSEVVLLGRDRLVHLANRLTDATQLAGQWFNPMTAQIPPIAQAMVQDMDLDGAPDLVALSQGKIPMLLRNRGGLFVNAPNVFGIPMTGPGMWIAAMGADVVGTSYPDLLLWHDINGLQLKTSMGRENRAIKLELTGTRDKGSNRRTNADGIGATVQVLAGMLRTTTELGTQSAGMGQSRLPISLGIGRAERADAVRIRWPDQVTQAELDLAADGTIHRIVETNRKGTSCPVLYVWNGQEFAYVTDFLGGGALGEMGPDGSVRPARPEETLNLPTSDMRPIDGAFRIRIGEPMDEMMYLDRVQLRAIDHPVDVTVLADERFATSAPMPTGKPIAIRNLRHPIRAVDHRGADQLSRITAADHRMVDSFRKRSWLGYAEEHWLEFHFDDLPDPEREAVLVLHGGIDYPYPESIFAASQAGVAMIPPQLERQRADGSWELVADLGFPAGLTRTMIRSFPAGSFRDGDRLRIRTNLQVYWDEIRLGTRLSEAEFAAVIRILDRAPRRAELLFHGFTREVQIGDSPLLGYDHRFTEPVSCAEWKGPRTLHGDVLQLLAAEDDRFVLCRPGEEVEIDFAADFPELPSNRRRTLQLQTWGYCKDNSPFTLTAGRVDPLPFRGMPSYPPKSSPDESARKRLP
ncbi:FG-GAP-like repeat-containing protein [Tuwongella immobilis]|uniref:ASPIC/UnbV domain-containing protein n=1 Tax=Tuwongella immobilis TaxID=692036 RepID=A0A6C2YME3_9BACT|nr:FG-GAP-like repeat-containing protein [Tuwongella immobilis]VIP02534.1 cytochrome c biogenesis factor : Cytochrome c biogenesis factor OS=Singulisphaera acidiphila (strain ATCC BAA-1392 / DSM 18658 / VKM B-2454 / MOB10) GN=Sinac_1700 PE=4 SV=1: TPR_2: TPR_11: VCBS: UnbV_ASPIC [Tuwongella immobilis]VTS01691.1 cytochrome c biogenesis factor : Cytochrome c biogenesis factor OS=Singulisphaera acidiphila (strain ATCC BAA-1392 / DSM 18658 / VKM B-2454 / MOB10) GN=Sinac_1700 PE=4 SV=1: TPR_2: TPR_11: